MNVTGPCICARDPDLRISSDVKSRNWYFRSWENIQIYFHRDLQNTKCQKPHSCIQRRIYKFGWISKFVSVAIQHVETFIDKNIRSEVIGAVHQDRDDHQKRWSNIIKDKVVQKISFILSLLWNLTELNRNVNTHRINKDYYLFLHLFHILPHLCDEYPHVDPVAAPPHWYAHT